MGDGAGAEILPPAEQAPAAAREVLGALGALVGRELSITERFTDKTRQTFALSLGFFTIVQTVAFSAFQEDRIHHLERTWLFALAMSAVFFLFLTAVATVQAERLVTVGELDVNRLLEVLKLANAGDPSALVYLAEDYAGVVKSQRTSNAQRRTRYTWAVRMASISVLATSVELVSALAFRI